MYHISETYKKTGNYILKILVVLAASYYLYERFSRMSLSGWDFIHRDIPFYQLLLCFFFPAVLNWAAEVKKWNIMVNTLIPETYPGSWKVSLTGHLFAVFTPFKSGEFIGKNGFYPQKIRKRLAGRIIAGNFWQMSITVIAGIAGIIFLDVSKHIGMPYFPFRKIVYLLAVVSGLLVTGSVFYAKSGLGTRWRNKDYILTNRLNAKVFFWSVLRYLIFSHQYYLLLKIFDFQVDYLTGMSLIAMVYLIASVLPVISLFDVAVKGSVALIVFSQVEDNELKIITVSTIMWLMNYVFPLIPGLFIFMFADRWSIRKKDADE